MERLRHLESLVKASPNKGTPEQRDRWRAWLRDVEAIRALRNDYAHGRWIRIWNQESAAVKWRLVPLGWATVDASVRAPMDVSIEDLVAQVKRIRAALMLMGDIVEPFRGN